MATNSHFVRGLTNPSGMAVVTMILTVVALAVACLLGLSSLMRSDYAPLLADSPTDHQLFVTAEVEKLSTVDDDRPLLAIIGASVTRSSFGRTSEIEQSAKEIAGDDFQVINFASGRQNLLEHLIFIGRLPNDRKTTIVLGVGPSRFTVTKDGLAEVVLNLRYGADSELFRDEAERLGLKLRPDTGWLLVDHYNFYLPRLWSIPKNFLRFAVGRRIEQNEREYVGTRKPEHFFRTHSESVIERFGDSDEALALNKELLIRTLNYVADQPNLEIVLVEHPINPRFIDEFLGRDRYMEHIDFMKKISDEHGVAYWTLGLDAELGDENFNDWAHISSAEAQRQLRTMLITRLAE